MRPIALGLALTLASSGACSSPEDWKDEVSGGTVVGYDPVALPGLVAVEDPAEARAVADAAGIVRALGPYAHAEDDTVFENKQLVLPEKPPGYYREYTVVTPGAKQRGTRRIVAGRGGELYYFAVAYRSPIALHVPPP